MQQKIKNLSVRISASVTKGSAHKAYTTNLHDASDQSCELFEWSAGYI